MSPAFLTPNAHAREHLGGSGPPADKGGPDGDH